MMHRRFFEGVSPLLIIFLALGLTFCSTRGVFPGDSPFKKDQWAEVNTDLAAVHDIPDIKSEIKSRFFKGFVVQIKGISDKQAIIDGKSFFMYRILASDGRDTWWINGAYLSPTKSTQLTATETFFTTQKSWSEKYIDQAKKAIEKGKLEESLKAYTEARTVYRFHYAAELGILRLRSLLKNRR